MEKCLCAETTTAKVRSQEQQENAINQRQADFNAWVDDTESVFYQQKTASRASTSPPAFRTAFSAASLILRRRSRASCSRLAFVLELPLGATPVKIFWLSWAVKLTKDTATDLLAPLGLLDWL
jgi:hypothetical protein